MPCTERESGIVDTHRGALELTASTENTFIFIRPTEYDSTVLIRAGYATKSMDVHHKSSNWGPMAGFVPCDPAFNKKCDGKPNPDEHEHKHGAAHPAQLGLSDDLLKVHEKIEVVTDFVLAAAPSGGSKLDVPWVAKRQTGTGAVGSLKGKFEALQSAGHIPEHKFCKAKPSDVGNKNTLFCLIRKAKDWMVYWCERVDDTTQRLLPLRVFAYPQGGRLNPVTGDYDLWMVAPHLKHLDRHLFTALEKDVHGSSAASPYTMSLIGKMNAACGRTENPVFNHGAESQNYGFTQALDWNLAMFTPGGSSRMVRMNQMPGILADLQQAGYLAVWNKRYGETDAHLMGAADKRGEGTLSGIRSTLDGLYRELDEIARTANPSKMAADVKKSGATGKAVMPDLMKAELSKMASRFEASRNLGLEQSRIYRFNRKLLALLETCLGHFRVLSPGDFPGSYRLYESAAHRLHGDLQRAMVGASTGGGQSDDKQLKDWIEAHKGDIESVKRYWT